MYTSRIIPCSFYGKWINILQESRTHDNTHYASAVYQITNIVIGLLGLSLSIQKKLLNYGDLQAV